MLNELSLCIIGSKVNLSEKPMNEWLLNQSVKIVPAFSKFHWTIINVFTMCRKIMSQIYIYNIHNIYNSFYAVFSDYEFHFKKNRNGTGKKYKDNVIHNNISCLLYVKNYKKIILISIPHSVVLCTPYINSRTMRERRNFQNLLNILKLGDGKL